MQRAYRMETTAKLRHFPIRVDRSCLSALSIFAMSLHHICLHYHYSWTLFDLWPETHCSFPIRTCSTGLGSRWKTLQTAIPERGRVGRGWRLEVWDAVGIWLNFDFGSDFPELKPQCPCPQTSFAASPQPRARHLDSDTIWRPKSTKWMTKQLGLRIKYWFLVMSKMFCLRTQLQSLSLEYPQAGDCAPLSPERCKKALQPFTGGLCWATLLNTSDTFDTLTATVSLWRDHCCRRLLCRWQRLPFRHVSTASIHTGLQKKVNLDELGLNWWGWLQLISWFDTTWCKYNDRSMTKQKHGPLTLSATSRILPGLETSETPSPNSFCAVLLPMAYQC